MKDTMIKFKQTELNLLTLLCDGKPHSVQEIKEAIDRDNPDTVDSWKVHVSLLRKKIEQQGYTIMYTTRSREADYSHYRLVRLLKERVVISD